MQCKFIAVNDYIQKLSFWKSSTEKSFAGKNTFAWFHLAVTNAFENLPKYVFVL